MKYCLLIGDKMYFNDIKNKQCIIKQEIIKSYSESAGLSAFEQECHFNVLREGTRVKGENEILVCCSHQPKITDLLKSEFFELTEVLLSSHERNKDFVLEVKGFLEPRGLTVRKKIHTFSEEEKKVRADRARKNFTKNI